MAEREITRCEQWREISLRGKGPLLYVTLTSFEIKISRVPRKEAAIIRHEDRSLPSLSLIPFILPSKKKRKRTYRCLRCVSLFAFFQSYHTFEFRCTRDSIQKCPELGRDPSISIVISIYLVLFFHSQWINSIVEKVELVLKISNKIIF